MKEIDHYTIFRINLSDFDDPAKSITYGIVPSSIYPR